jgi:tetratricopeptide (TPR) repeat protein
MLRRFIPIAVVLATMVSTPAFSQTAAPAEAKAAHPAPDAAPAELVQQADALRSRKDYTAALEFYRAALKKSPGDSDIYNRMGIARIQLGEYRQARNDFEGALKLNPGLAEAYNNAGVACYLQRDVKRAIRYYEKALAVDESSASFHSNLGAALFARKRFDRAMLEYERALQLDPAVFERTAASGVTARLASPEDRARYAYMLAKLYAKAGDSERALQQLKKSREYGYSRIQDAYKDTEFSALRKDRRFAQVMGREAVAVPES